MAIPAPPRRCWWRRALDVGDWERAALALARRAAARPPASCGVADPWLCHGAAGLGHVFNRLYQATGDGALAAAARSWLERALAMRDAGDGGVCGYRPPETGRSADGTGTGFLEGAAGVALALLAATSDVDPGWDRVLAISPVFAPRT